MTTMRTLFILCLFIFSYLNCLAQCDDENVYASETQTKYNKTFDSYPKIDNAPKFSGKDFNKLIESNLKLSNEAKEIIFRLNYSFVVKCDGTISDVKIFGDSKIKDYTNIQEIIQESSNNWIPAAKDGKKVNCIFFGKKTIVGNKY